MPGLKFCAICLRKVHALLLEDATVKHTITELEKRVYVHAGKLCGDFDHYRRHKTTNPLPRSGQLSKFMERIQDLMEEKCSVMMRLQ